MGRYLDMNAQALSAAGLVDRLESFVDEEIWPAWVRSLGEGEARFDSTVAPWYEGPAYPATAAKKALAEWWLERHFAIQVREHERVKAAQQLTVPDFEV